MLQKDLTSMPFNDILLELLQQRLNMMLSETCQLALDEIAKKRVAEYHYLIKKILKGIAEGKIHSIHMTKEFAQNAIIMYESFTFEDNERIDEKAKEKLENSTVYKTIKENFPDCF